MRRGLLARLENVGEPEDTTDDAILKKVFPVEDFHLMLQSEDVCCCIMIPEV
jgi:hypothetical protein